jgi:uncharacterized protein YlxW (UPF0749 family)
MTMDFFSFLIGCLVLIFLLWNLFGKKGGSNMETEEKLQYLGSERNRLSEEIIRLQIELEGKNTALGESYQSLRQERSEKNKLEGKEKQIIAENIELKSDKKHLQNENNELKKKVSEWDAHKKQEQSFFEEKIKKLEYAQKTLEAEKIRIIREDEEKQSERLQEQSRIWNEHEKKVLLYLREVCQKPELCFQFYDNASLPDSFDGSVKPDFLVKFLDQYILFDAKFTSQKNANIYFSDQVKKTAKKYHGNIKIYPTIFFVVPENRISEIKQYSFFEEEFSFFIVSQFSIEPILVNFKRMAEYKKISDLDPRDRESIVHLIAQYDRHISFQNSTNILLTKESLKLMEIKELLPSDIQTEIGIRKRNIRPIKFKDSEMKRLSQDSSQQKTEIQHLISPFSSAEKEDMDTLQKILKTS